MSVTIYVAPAGAGKTECVLGLAREAGQDVSHTPRVLLANRAQIRSCRQRLARAGGAIGIRLLTCDDLYLEILQAAGEHPVRLPDPVQVRVVRAMLNNVPPGALEYFEPLRQAPSLAAMLRDLWFELQSAGVTPKAFDDYARTRTARLRDLARLYTAYHDRLGAADWADYASLGTRALEVLKEHPAIGSDWPLLIVDGIDDYGATQIGTLEVLGDRVGRTVITLTGDTDESTGEPVYRGARASRHCLVHTLGVKAEPLPAGAPTTRTPALVHLERTVHGGDPVRCPADGALRTVAAPDREGEVRVALRWLKQRIVGGVPASSVALLARDMEPYRVPLQQAASEYGIPLALAAGIPLGDNPAVAALVGLLRLAVPANGQPASAYPWRQTVDAWRNPYFDWASLGILPGDADRLDQVAHRGNVVGGLDQWRETLAALCDLAPEASEDDETPAVPELLPTGPAAVALLSSVERFMHRITPPGTGDDSAIPCRDYVRWLEELIGDTTGLVVGEPDSPDEPAGAAIADALEQSARVDVGLARRAAAAPKSDDPIAEREELALASRDITALNGLKDVLRGLVWAEEALQTLKQTAQSFVDDLLGAIQSATYVPPLPEGVSGIFAGTVAQARGLPFEVVAVLGLAEGEFPATLREDSLLRDRERAELNEHAGVRLRLRTDSTEAELFYTAITRPSGALLLTRPRIADNGGLWQPSPYWEDVLRHVQVSPEELTTSTRPPPGECASWPELWQAAAPGMTSGGSVASGWALAQRPEEAQAVRAGAVALAARIRRKPQGSPLEGDLSVWAADWALTLGPGHLWSVTQLETYRRCPYSFLVGRLLRLEPRRGPVEGLDARQVGTLYHRILAAVYRDAAPAANLAELLSRLDASAQTILDEAPRREGFRPAAWWQHTRETMLRNLRNTLRTLEAPPANYAYMHSERSFGWSGTGYLALIVTDASGDAFRLGGKIDRIDQGSDGSLRIIDYKSGGVSAYSAAALVRGEDLQIALYALAVEQALGLRPVAEGYYWSVAQVRASSLRLSSFSVDGSAGPRAAAAVAVRHSWQAVHSARAGVFTPTPPPGGCPSYCPAATHCWHYREGWS